MSQSAFAARNPRLLAGPLMRNALGVRRFAAPAGDLAQSGSIEQCESSEMFGGHGVLVIHGLSLATRITRDLTVSPSGRLLQQSAARRGVLQRQSHSFLLKITRGSARLPTGCSESL